MFFFSSYRAWVVPITGINAGRGVFVGVCVFSVNLRNGLVLINVFFVGIGWDFVCFGCCPKCLNRFGFDNFSIV